MDKKMKYPNLCDVKITDTMWKHYIDLVSDIIIPYQWEVLNDRVEEAAPSHCIDNFRIAAGEMEGEFYGMVFQDSDVYKWLEAVAFSIDNGTGKKYETIADEVIELLERAQQSDGYLNTYYLIKEPGKRFTNLREGHELYCAGHMLEAAAAYYHATGKRKFIEIAKKYADLLCRTFGIQPGQLRGYPGHQEIEIGLLKLYEIVQEKKYLDLARFFIETRGEKPNYFLEEMKQKDITHIFSEMDNYDPAYSQSDKSPILQKNATGHAVRAMYMYSAMAEIADLCADTEWGAACDALWDSTVNRRMYLTGGIGSSGFLECFTTDYDLPNDRAYCESCASIGLMMFGQRMAAARKDASYIDIVEKALYNTVLAGVNREGNRYFYVNPLEVWPDNCIPNTSMGHVKPVRQKWFDVACCPTNIARTLASLGHYMYSYDEHAVYVNLFISSETSFMVEEEKISLTQNSSFTQNGKVDFTVEISNHHGARILIRRPEYVKGVSISVDGRHKAVEMQKNYMVFTFEEAGQYNIGLEYDIEYEWIAANPQVRADAGKTALMRGPYVYCLEEIDNGKNLSAVYIPSHTIVHETDELFGIPTLTFLGKRMKEWSGRGLYRRLEFEFEQVTLKAVPYCTWGNRMPGEMSVWQKIYFSEG